jgi:hypothetical protein
MTAGWKVFVLEQRLVEYSVFATEKMMVDLMESHLAGKKEQLTAYWMET